MATLPWAELNPFSSAIRFANLITSTSESAKRRILTEAVVSSIEYSAVRKGQVIVGDDGQLYTVVDRDLNTPGNWRAILTLKLKNLKTGNIAVNRVRPQDKVDLAY